MPEPVMVRRPILLAVAALVCLVWLVFWPMLGFDFVDFDVRQQLLHNPHVQGLSVENLKYIFTSRCVTSYYPVRTLSFALDYQAWGLNPTGFKLTNGLIHAANVLLVFWLILRFFGYSAATEEPGPRWWEICVATFSVAIFAVHPLVVEPVAWVAGREELLMTMGALACVHFHVLARRSGEEVGSGRKTLTYHALAAVCCAAACLSNAVGAVIPFLIVAWDILSLPGPKLRKIICGTSVLWAIGLATIAIKVLNPTGDLVANQLGVLSVHRPALIFNVYWLNLKSLVWPMQLTIEYPPIPPRGLLDWEVVAGGIAIGVTCGGLWLLRRKKVLLFGLVWFCLALGPTAQIMPHHVHRADRFLYLPLVGLAISIAIGARPIAAALKGQVTALVIAGLGLVSLLAVLSTGQVWTWQNSISMWENCLRTDPDSVGAHSGLADALAKAGLNEKAFEHHRTAVLKDPTNPNRLSSFALFLATCRQEEFRDQDLALQLAERACQLTKRRDPAFILALAEVHSQAGRSEIVVALMEEAIHLAESNGDRALADELEDGLKLYRSRKDQ